MSAEVDAFDPVWELFMSVTENPPNVSSADACGHCGLMSVRLDSGNYICSCCSTVNARFIDASAEWRFVDGSGRADLTRCGMPVNELIPNASFGSYISYRGGKECEEMKSIRRYSLWTSLPYKDRVMAKTFERMNSLSVANGIPKSIIERAKALYKQVSVIGVTRGVNRNSIIASSVYISCKQEGVPRSAKEIAGFFSLPIAAMTRGCKRFEGKLGLSVEPSMAMDFVGRFSSSLGLSREKTLICEQKVYDVEKNNFLSNAAPTSVAAACVFACDKTHAWGIGKKKIAEACNVSCVTITKCIRASPMLLL